MGRNSILLFDPFDCNNEDGMTSAGDLIHFGRCSRSRLSAALHHLHDLVRIVHRPFRKPVNEDTLSAVLSDHEGLFFFRKQVCYDLIVDLKVAHLDRLDALGLLATYCNISLGDLLKNVMN